MSTISAIHSEGGRKLLDVIDNLRLLPSINHEIALPQIVVVGQQSSGKSSVLKAISNVNFPTNSGFCTQFATEIVCRREPHRTAKAQIVSASTVDDQYRARLDAFSKEWSHIPADQDISKIIDSAKQVMGLNQHRRISKDKLRLEFSGPNQDHISLIDLPGLFEQELPGQREHDKRLVDEMVIEHISGEHTIVLAVVSGAYDVQVQRIFRMFEPHKDKTLGIVTAPDLVESGTARATAFSKLVANLSFQAGHGWHVLRNLSHREEREGKNRDLVEEDFFSDRASNSADFWASVSDSRIGIRSLKTRLAALLQSRIAQGLPQIQRQLRDALVESRDELELLGSERITIEQQRDYVADKSEILRLFTKHQLYGHDKKSLRSQIRKANNRFADDMAKFGASWKFVSAVSNQTSNAEEEVDPNLPVPMSSHQWVIMMLDEILDSRGCELEGLVDPMSIGRMFLKQNRKWARIAKDHLETTFQIVEQYFSDTINTVIGSENAIRFLDHIIQPELERRHTALEEKLTEILTPYSTQYIKTLNRNFSSQQYNIIQTPFTVNDSDTLIKETICRQTILMEQYYHVALAVFTDNVESLAIENVLLGRLEDIMTAKKAYRMTESDIAQLASESEEIIERRKSLMARVQDYEEGNKILSRYTIRGHLPANVKLQSTTVQSTASSALKFTLQPTNGVAPATFHQSSPSLFKFGSLNANNERQTRGLMTGNHSSRESSVASSIFSDDHDATSSVPSSVNSTPAKSKSSFAKVKARSVAQCS